MQLKKFTDLFLDCHDATVFSQRKNKPILQNIFYFDRNLVQLDKENRYFIIGEKGTGKTAIANYATNSSYNNRSYSIVQFSELDFPFFQKLRKTGEIHLSPMSSIWEVILLSLTAQHIVSKNKSIINDFWKFRALRSSLSDYLDDRYDPELTVSTKILEHATLNADLAATAMAKVASEVGVKEESIEYRTSIPLQKLSFAFRDAISQLKLEKDQVVFIDSIDIKPDDISYDEFIEVVRALGSAAWSLNHNFFSNIKDSKGRIRIVLLVRPDIFSKFNLPNQAARVSDNSIVLRWEAKPANFPTSSIFVVSDQVLKNQTDKKLEIGKAWDYYISDDVTYDVNRAGLHRSFLEFLRYSWQRPRDIIKQMHIMQEYMIEHSMHDLVINRDIFDATAPTFSDYLLSEVQDYMRFYYRPELWIVMLTFFPELRIQKEFSYDTFIVAHSRFVQKRAKDIEKFNNDADIISDPDKFLQLLFESNMICWKEFNDFGKEEQHWAFRERTASNMTPIVQPYVNYSFHIGLRRSLNLNRAMAEGISFY